MMQISCVCTDNTGEQQVEGAQKDWVGLPFYCALCFLSEGLESFHDIIIYTTGIEKTHVKCGLCLPLSPFSSFLSVLLSSRDWRRKCGWGFSFVSIRSLSQIQALKGPFVSFCDTIKFFRFCIQKGLRVIHETDLLYAETRPPPPLLQRWLACCPVGFVRWVSPQTSVKSCKTTSCDL